MSASSFFICSLKLRNDVFRNFSMLAIHSLRVVNGIDFYRVTSLSPCELRGEASSLPELMAPEKRVFGAMMLIMRWGGIFFKFI